MSVEQVLIQIEAVDWEIRKWNRLSEEAEEVVEFLEDSLEDHDKLDKVRAMNHAYQAYCREERDKYEKIREKLISENDSLLRLSQGSYTITRPDEVSFEADIKVRGEGEDLYITTWRKQS